MSSKLYKETQQILLGFEQLYPGEEIIPLVRFLIEKLNYPDYSREDFLSDVFKIIKTIENFPITSQVEQFILASDTKEKMISLMGLIEYLTYDELASNTKLLLKHVNVDEAQEKNVHKMILSILTSFEETNKALFFIKNIYLEKDKLISLKKLMKLYDFLYDRPIFDRLRKLAEHFETLKSDFEVWNFLSDMTSKQTFERLRFVKQNYNNTKIQDAFSKGQIKSKLWLASELNRQLGNEMYEMHILCGWYATLMDCLFQRIDKSKIKSVKSYDIDPKCLDIALALHEYGFEEINFSAATQDIFEINYKLIEKKNCIINSSCEHINRFSDWFELIPAGQLLVLQNNNFFNHKEHVNCTNNLEEFKKMAPLSEFLYAGELNLEKYNRYMLIGYK